MFNNGNLQPRRFPEPQRPFVNRKKELEIVQNKVDIGIQGKPVPTVITCFWGPYGMGKSWLVGEIERRYRFSGLRDVGCRPTLTARIDLSRERVPTLWQNNKFDRTQLVRELWKQLSEQLNMDKPTTEQLSPEQWVDEFVMKVTSWSSDFTVLLMFDTVDDLITWDEKSFFWLERTLVERLVLTDRVLFIFTSRGELRQWNRFQVRQRVDSHKLLPFDLEATGKQVGADDPLRESLYNHAFGHPLVTDYLGSLPRNQEDITQESYDRKDSIDILMVRTVLENIVTEIMAPMKEAPPELVKCISVLRWLSIEPIHYLAEELNIFEQHHGDAYYQELIVELQRNHVLYWNGVQKIYEFDPVLRRIFSHFLEMKDPALFSNAHLAAFAFHESHLEKYPQYPARYIPELVYHRSILNNFSTLENPPITIQLWWEKYLETTSSKGFSEPWKELQDALKLDEELKLLNFDEYHKILSDVKKRVSH